MRSAWNGERPLLTRRTTESNKSARGTSRTAIGTRIGTKAGKSSARETTFGFTWPVTVTVDAASVSPKNMAPESPMKMRAGWKLWGEKPRQTPTSAAAKSEAREEMYPGEV